MPHPSPINPHSAHYRAMTEQDIPAALALWTLTEGVEIAEGDGPADLLRYLRRNPGMSQVATRTNVIVGAILAGHDGRRGYLYHLSVLPELRGVGVGRELVARSLQSLREAGIPRTLILVARGNAIGIAFWQRLGWEPLDSAEPLGFDL